MCRLGGVSHDAVGTFLASKSVNIYDGPAFYHLLQTSSLLLCHTMMQENRMLSTTQTCAGQDWAPPPSEKVNELVSLPDPSGDVVAQGEVVALVNPQDPPAEDHC